MSRPRGYPTAQLLLDLIGDPLDAGYRQAAERKAAEHRPRRRRWLDSPLVALGCVLIGFLLVVSYEHTHRGAPQAAKVHADLVTRVRDAEHANDQLAQQLQRLDRSLSAVRSRALPGANARGLAAAALAAGQTAVKGPGLEVQLREPARTTTSTGATRQGTTPIDSTSVLTDRDVRSVVNQLWAEGAQAISVNDIRLTPASAIRFAGQAVLVDFQPITSPYVIRAIGNAADLDTSFAESDVASRYQTLVDANGIGFTFTEEDHLSLPAAEPTATRYARPLPSASATPSGTR